MSSFVLPDSKTIVDPITDVECTNLGNNNGLDIADGETTCQALQTRLMPLLSQILGDISSGTMTIFANEDSKCEAEDPNPTLASMLSRIYRISQAFTCILCEYDPTLSNMLKSGTYPQVLMGKQTANGYPRWVTPDSAPTAGSSKPVTSGGVYTAIQNAILSVWHMWDKGNAGSFAYFVNAVADLPTSGNTNGDYSIVYNTSTYENKIYKWNGSSWALQETIPATDMEDFAVVHIEKGDWADKGLYWFDTSWNLLDADLGEVEARVDALEETVSHTVQAADTSTTYLIGTSTAANIGNIPSETGKTKIIFITG